MTRLVNIRDRDLAIVRAVLGAGLPQGAVVRVFGSRARGAARRASDLDLAIDAGRPLTRAESGALADAFEDSDLPYTVDVVDTHMAGAAFLEAIAADWTPLPGGIKADDLNIDVRPLGEESPMTGPRPWPPTRGRSWLFG